MTAYTEEHKKRLIDLHTEEQLRDMPGGREAGNFPCFNPGHGGPDKNGSMRYYPESKWAFCFKCSTATGKGFNLFDMIGIQIGSDDFMEQYEAACKKFDDYPSEGTPRPDSRKRPQKTAQEARETENRISTQPDAPDASKRKIESLGGKGAEEADKKAKEEGMRRATAIGRAVIKAAAGGVQKHPEAKAYLEGRGFTEEIIERLEIGFLKEYPARPDLANRIVFHTPGDGGRFIARTIDDNDGRPKYLKTTGLSPDLWNAAYLKEKGTGPIFIVEGEIDAMTISEMCGHPAIGLAGASTKGRLIAAARDAKESILSEGDKALIIIPDPDKTGEEAAAVMLQELRGEGIPAILARIPIEEIKGEKKVDANSAYMYDPEAFRDFLGAAVEKAAKFAHNPEAVQEEEREERLREYDKGNHAAILEDFEAWAIRRAAFPFIPTGFKILDASMNGGLREELYILGGVPSSGKTTIALQMADQIAESGAADVLYFSLEQGRYELTSKSLSRLSWEEATVTEREDGIPRSNMGIIASYGFAGDNEAQLRIMRLRDRAAARYRAYKGRIRIIEAGDLKAADMGEAVEAHYKATGRKPVVFLDYLQKIGIGNTRITDTKPRIDQAITELKQLSRDKQIPVIAISSLNRDGYAAPGMKSLKESGDLEYSADIVLLLSFRAKMEKGDVEDYIDKESHRVPREMVLKIAKNRNGEKGHKINIDYYSAYNRFKECKDQPKAVR